MDEDEGGEVVPVVADEFEMPRFREKDDSGEDVSGAKAGSCTEIGSVHSATSDDRLDIGYLTGKKGNFSRN